MSKNETMIVIHCQTIVSSTSATFQLVILQGLIFTLKGNNIHPFSPLSIPYYYNSKIQSVCVCIQMKGNVMKEQAKIMRRRENLELEPKGSQTTPKLE
jgi:hypothetical protein